MPSVLTVVGPFTGDNGMAEFARHFREELERSPIQAAFVDVRLKTLADHRRIDLQPVLQASPPGTPVLFLLNPPELLPLARQLGAAFFASRPTAALWWWEASRLPPDWRLTASLLDEIWVSTDYIQATVTSEVGRACRCPLPALWLAPRTTSRALPATGEGTRFLVTFDYRSTVERKNPDGALRAYLDAFPRPRPGVTLTIKTQAAERVPFEARRLRRMAKGRPDVTFIDRNLSRAEMDRLFETSTCYVSLHRSEGLGMGILEAMRAGKPVIATGFSGNLHFMPVDYPLLVRWHPALVPKGTPVYRGEWADPDLAHAASLMRAIADDPAFGIEAARRGLDHLEALAKSEHLADFVARSLPRLAAAPHRPPLPGSPVWRTDEKGRRIKAVLDKVEPPLRKVPWLHKLGMDLYFGRYRRSNRTPRDRGPATPP